MLRIARAEDTATKEDLQVVLTLIEDARKWLATMGTDQWAEPYPDADGKLIRVQEGIERGETWIVWDGEVPAATVTIRTERNNVVWSEDTTVGCDLSEPAVYVHQLITARRVDQQRPAAQVLHEGGLRVLRYVRGRSPLPVRRALPEAGDRERVGKPSHSAVLRILGRVRPAGQAVSRGCSSGRLTHAAWRGLAEDGLAVAWFTGSGRSALNSAGVSLGDSTRAS